MVATAGWVALPVVPVFDGISREIDKQISGPLSKASKQAGDALEKGIGAKIKQLGDRAEKAQYRVKKATQELEQAQSKVTAATNAQAAAQAKVEAAAIKVSEAQRKHETAVNSALDAYERMRKSGTASADELAAAEQKITDVRSKGQADIVSKEGALESARGRLVTATQRVTDAQNKLNDAELEHLTASSKAEKAADELAKAQADAGRATEETSGIFDKFRSQVRDMGSEMEETARKSGGFGSMLADGFKTMGKGALMGVGAKAGTMLMDGVHTAVSKGMDRLGAIEQAQTMLKGLGHDAESVQSIMDSASKSVDGTAFGLGEAAGLAATFSAAGVKEGDDLTRVLKLVADTAAITGKELGDIGPIFAKVAARGKLGTEEMNQLLERQLGIMPALQEKYGKTAEEVQKMVTEGKVSFEDFADVMEGMVGGSAETMGNTFSASLKNMQAALGRVGATLLKPVFQNAPILFNAVKDALKAVQKQLEPIMEEVSARLTPVVEKFAQSLGPALVGVINGIGDAFAWITQKTGPVVDQMKLIGEAVQVAFGEISHAFQGDDWGFGQLAEWFGGDTAQTIVNAAAMIGDAFRGAKDAVSEFAGALMGTAGDALRAFGDAVRAVWELVGPLLVPALENLAGITGGVLAAGFKMAVDTVTALSGAVTWLIENAVRPTLNLIETVVNKTRESETAMDLLRGTLVAVGGALAGLAGAWAATNLPVMAAQFKDVAIQAGKAAWNMAKMAAASVVKGFQAMTSAVRDAGGAWKALNTVMSANPVTFWLTALSALAAGLTYFFTQTETGRRLWSEFTSSIGEKWAELTGALSSAWETMAALFASVWDGVILPVFQAFVTAGQWLVGIIGTVVLTPLILAWKAMSWAIKAGWEKIIKPAWDAVAAGAQWLWNNALKPTFDMIVAGWNALGDAFRWVYDNAIKPVWDALVWVAQTAWDGVNAIFGWLQAGWEALGAGMRWVNENVIQPVWDTFAAGLHWLHDSVVAPVTGWIAEKWQQMGNALETVKTFVVDTVFGGLKSGLDAVQNWFNSIVDAIGNKWNELRGHLAKPINFMINTVYNDGILRAWNVIAGILPGLNKGDRLTGIPGYATGGRIKGPGTGTSDDILAWLSNGEHVWTAREVQAIGGHNVLDALRDAILHRRGFTFDGAHATLLPGRVNNRVGDLAGAAPDLLPKFARGGRVDDSKIRPLWELQLMKAHEFAKAQHGKPYQWAGPTGPGTSFDCSGFMGAIAATIQDTNPWQRYWATMSFPSPGAQGFVPGLGAGFSVGMFNGGPWGGHTAGTLSAVGPYSAVNVESGGSPSMVKYGVGAVGADDRQFTMHYHLPIGADGGFVSGGTGGVDPEMMRSRIAETLHKAINVVMEPIKGQLPAPPPAWLGIPGGVFDAGRDGLVGFVDNGVKALGDGLGTVFTAVSSGAESLVDRGRDAVGAAMNFLGARVFDRGGLLRKGQMAVNLGNADEHVISEKSFQNFSVGASVLGIAAEEFLEAFRGGDLGYGALAATLRNEEWAKSIVNGAAMLGKIADYNSLEGVAARSFATEMAGIVGMLGGTTISGITTSLVDAERDIWDAREASADRLEGIAEKEKALEEARANAAKLRSDAPELSVKDQRKLADAEEALAKARKEADESANSNAKSEEARAKSKEKSDQKVADAEKKLARVREDLGIKEGESAEKRSEDIQKADEQVVKAEKELAAARKVSARALDIRIYDVAPQINGMLSQAAEATVQVPAVSQALAGLAAAAGPAGMTVGVALQYVKSTIQVVQKVGAAIGDFVARIFDARAKTYANMVTVLNLQHEWAKMVDEQAAKVVELRVAWVEAQVALRDATWKTRLAQADVVRAQLQGVKSVAEAEAKLEAERKRVAQAALFDFDDLSLAYDRYRWAEYQGMKDRLDLYAQVTPEILALEAEVNVAKLNALAAQKEASLSALQASWEQQKAALALMQTQQNLALQTQQLAVMQREFFGMSQADSLQAMNTMKLRQELAEVQAQQGKNFWRLSYWLTGAHRADNQRERELKAQIAQREGSGAGVNVGGTGGLMSFFGYGDSALNAAKNAGYGKAERAMFEAQEQQALLQIEQQKQQLQQQIEQSKLFEEYQKQIGALMAEIESLKTGASAAQYTADYYREENPAVKAANLALARFEAERSSQYAAVGRGEKQVVEVTIPEQDVYTREQMELVLRSVQEIPELEARIRKVEAPATPGANVAMRSMIGG